MSQPYTYDFKNPRYQTIYGIKCKLPTPLPDKECENFGLPIAKQKFKRVVIPEDLFEWQFMGDDKKEEMEKFIENEYNRRKNGIWIFIKGQKMYIPGPMYFFLNYWIMETGNLPTFKTCDLDFFLVWFHVVHHPNIYGMVDFKPRRIGDTEKALCIVYEYATRVRNIRCGMQSNTGDDIKEKFTDRLIYAHDKMVWFMKPINRGSTNPQEGLILDYPVTFNSAKSIKERIDKGEKATTSSDEQYAYPPVKSKIDYKPSVPKAYNGKRLGRYYCDEFGMMEEMDPNEAWNLVKMAQKDKNTNEIIGKALFTANIDEVGKATDGEDFSRKSMEYAHQLFEESDPDKLDENGETQSGLIRILRTWRDNCPVDAWGFPDIGPIEIERKNTIRNLTKKRKIAALYQYRRQNPENWDDVFLSSGEKSGMDVERLLAREQLLKDPIDAVTGKKAKKLYFRANLEWKDHVFGGEVVMIPHNEGLWWISWNGLPADHNCESNARSHPTINKPGNIDVFCMATDPYDEKNAIDKKPSLGAFAVRTLFNSEVDGLKVCTEEKHLLDNLELGDPLNYGEDWLSDKYAAVYLHRHADPKNFYEDGLKTAIFWGTDNLIEKNKGADMIGRWDQWGFGAYVQDRPEFSKPDSAKGTNTQGIYAVEQTKELYFKLLKSESVKRANTIDIPIVCDQIATLNWKNATKKDLAVCCGLSHIAALRNVRRRKRNKQEEHKQRTQLYQLSSV